MGTIRDFYSFISDKSEHCCKSFALNPELYGEYNVKRGLRDKNGNGVLAGLTSISSIKSFEIDDEGNKQPIDGELLYRGYNINDLVNGAVGSRRYGFEEAAYLLLFGELPDKQQLEEFSGFVREDSDPGTGTKVC